MNWNVIQSDYFLGCQIVNAVLKSTLNDDVVDVVGVVFVVVVVFMMKCNII